MRPRQEKLVLESHQHSYIGYRVIVPTFEFYWHFHPEYELTLIVKGRGKRLVGDSMVPFTEGDLVLLGPNLPHVWVSNEKETGPCEAIVFQFPASFLENLLRFPEMRSLESWIKNAQRGLDFSCISSAEKASLKEHMLKLIANPSLPDFLQMVSSLSVIQAEPIAATNYPSVKTPGNSTRINTALRFIQLNYLQPVTIKNVAEAIHLSESAFSKFFQRNLGTSFTSYLQDLRIAHACNLLLETDQPIRAIALASGFENISYFNLVFLKQKKISPSVFRKLRGNT